MMALYRLNKQGDSRQPCYTPSSTLNQLVVPYRVPTVVSWPEYRFLRRQVRRSGIHISLRAFQFIMIHTVKGFGVVDETEVDVFLEFHCLLSLWSSECLQFDLWFLPSFSKPSLDIWKFLVHIMLKCSMQDFKRDLTSMGDKCNCPMVSIFFRTTLLGNWDEDWPLPVL